MMSYLEFYIAGAILIVALIVTVVAQVRVSSTYSKYSQIPSKCGITGADLAQKIIDAAGLNVK